MSQNKLPAIFIGHGSPMNILAENSFTSDMVSFGYVLPKPEAIVVISAHWLTRGTFITSGAQPGQIYDFYGFPDELYRCRYRAPGSPEVAKMIADIAGGKMISPDPDRGIDHAAWSVLIHLFPEQNIPVLELSLDISREPVFHFELGQKLAELREQNILFIGSGNIVHNLSDVDFNDDAEPFEWATKFDLLIKDALEKKDFDSLINYKKFGLLAKRAIPFNDHYLPMLYVLGMTGPEEKLNFIHESVQNGSISMRSFITG